MTDSGADYRQFNTAGMSFTYDCYRDLIVTLSEHGVNFVGYDRDVSPGEVVLRHDVDWSPQRARRLGEIEAELGATSTFFFLLSNPFYNLFHEPHREVVAELLEMGHNVGLHFSTHQYWDSEPDNGNLSKVVNRERRILSELIDTRVDTVAFHIPPEWILKREFVGFVSTYEPRFFDDIAYRSDSNQRWREEPPFDGGVPQKLQLLAHPGLWGDSDLSFENRLRNQITDRLESIETFLERQYLPE